MLVQIRQAVHELDSYGYRRACELVNRRRQANREPGVNVKLVYRVMREHGLLLQRHTGRPADTRGHNGRVSVDHSDLRWCSDGFEITCDNKQKVRVAFSLDCCDREAIGWLTDNGSPYVARQTQHFASQVGLVLLTTPISSPQSNGMAESFVKTFKRDYVRRMDRSNAASVIAQLPSAFEHYNEVHPHSALKMKSPRMFRRAAQGLHVNSN
ncbi:MAG: integrase core domain-containing protein [Aquabacterium sp.]